METNPGIVQIVKQMVSAPGWKEYFFGQLNEIFPNGWRRPPDGVLLGYIAVDGTAGWNEALKNTLLHFKQNDVWEFYDKLDWFESDDFDWELEKALDCRIYK